MRAAPESSWRKPATHALLAVGGGLAWSLCFERQPSLWLPWVALVPLFLLIEAQVPARRAADRRIALWGWLFGVVTWLAAMPWIISTLVVFGSLPRSVSTVALLLLALYLGSYQGLFVLVGQRIRSAGEALSLWTLPALWVVLESLRSFLFGGFPWNQAAYAWVGMPGALQLSAWIGTPGVSFLLLWTNGALARAWVRRDGRLAALALLAPLLMLILAGRWSAADDRESGLASPAGRQVRVLQPNSPIVTTAEAGRENYLRLIAMSETECRTAGGEPMLLIWPESAAWPFSYERSAELRRDLARLNALGCEVLLGSVRTDGGKYYNTTMLVAGGLPVAEYAKRKLVPWGEYVPLGDLIPIIGRLARNAGDFSPGDSPALLPWGDERFGAAICYEVVFGTPVAEQVRAGATILVTITNDAWYGDTAAPWQHFRAARFRAAENRRPMLRAALTGVSALIDRRGQLGGRLGVGEQGVLAARVRGARGLTLYSRAPWLVPAACYLLAAFAIVAGNRKRI